MRFKNAICRCLRSWVPSGCAARSCSAEGALAGGDASHDAKRSRHPRINQLLLHVFIIRFYGSVVPSVYWTLVSLQLLSLREGVAHRSEKFFIVERLDEESHRADLHRRRAGRQIVTRRDDDNPGLR